MNEIQSKITCLTEKLMADYGKGRVIDEIKMFAYPDRNIIIDILEKLKIVMSSEKTSLSAATPSLQAPFPRAQESA